jgi:lysophospholipase L1-like esterase
VEVLNLGLGSETASNLTPQENEGHLKTYGFGRPNVSERLERALTATKPDLLFVCYGMNDAGALPSDATGDGRFVEAITHLRETALKLGVKRIVLCTPPVQDAKGNAAQKFYDQNLARYTAWLLSKRSEGWEVVDFHTPMRNALDKGRAKNPAFMFAKDGVHPGREGHWLMVREIIRQFFGANVDGIASAEELFPSHGAEIRKLVYDRMQLLFDAWMTKIGHTRPGVAGGPGAKPSLPPAEATVKAAEMTTQIKQAIANLKP